MRTTSIAILSILGLAAALAAHADTAKPAGAKAGPTDAELIKSAMSAVPAAVGKNATIVAMEADGKMRTIRKGTNGFTCMPDNPATPGPDPMCMDAAAMEWVHAWVAHKPPPAGRVGLMYMLEGGTDASNTDPYAEEPTAQNHWIETGPHGWWSARTARSTSSTRRTRIRTRACPTSCGPARPIST